MLSNPRTGEQAAIISVWFELEGEKVDRWRERRVIRVPAHMLNDDERLAQD